MNTTQEDTTSTCRRRLFGRREEVALGEVGTQPANAATTALEKRA